MVHAIVQYEAEPKMRGAASRRGRVFGSPFGAPAAGDAIAVVAFA